MERVANAGELSLKGMLCLSFLVHMVILTVLIMSPSVPGPTLTFGPVYSVQLVGMPVSSMPAASKASEGSSLKELMRVDSSLQQPIGKESTRSLQEVPIESLATKKKAAP